MYARLERWGYVHKSVNHGRGAYARDEDGDGFCEVHVNTMEGFWSLLRSWLRPHRGISQEKLSHSIVFSGNAQRWRSLLAIRQVFPHCGSSAAPTI
jgi:hypothetical protein